MHWTQRCKRHIADRNPKDKKDATARARLLRHTRCDADTLARQSPPCTARAPHSPDLPRNDARTACTNSGGAQRGRVAPDRWQLAPLRTCKKERRRSVRVRTCSDEYPDYKD